MDSIQVLKEVDFQIKKGEFVCIVGDVGSGKSSLLSALIGDLLLLEDDQIFKYQGDKVLDKEERTRLREYL